MDLKGFSILSPLMDNGFIRDFFFSERRISIVRVLEGKKCHIYIPDRYFQKIKEDYRQRLITYKRMMDLIYRFCVIETEHEFMVFNIWKDKQVIYKNYEEQFFDERGILQEEFI